MIHTEASAWTESSNTITVPDTDLAQMITTDSLKNILWGGKDKLTPNLVNQLNSALIAGGAQAQADAFSGPIEGYQSLLYSATNSQSLSTQFISVAQPNPEEFTKKNSIAEAMQDDYTYLTGTLYKVVDDYIVEPNEISNYPPNDTTDNASTVQKSTAYNDDIQRIANMLLQYTFYETIAESCLNNYNSNTGFPPETNQQPQQRRAPFAMLLTKDEAEGSSDDDLMNTAGSVVAGANAPTVGCYNKPSDKTPNKPSDKIPNSVSENDTSNNTWYNGWGNVIFYLNEINSSTQLDLQYSSTMSAQKEFNNNLKSIHDVFKDLTGESLLNQVQSTISSSKKSLNEILISLLTLKYNNIPTSVSKANDQTPSVDSSDNMRTLVHKNNYNETCTDDALFSYLKNQSDSANPLNISNPSEEVASTAKDVKNFISNIGSFGDFSGPQLSVDANCSQDAECKNLTLLPANGRVLVFEGNKNSARTPKILAWEGKSYKLGSSTSISTIKSNRAKIKSKIISSKNDLKHAQMQASSGNSKALLAITALYDIYAKRAVKFEIGSTSCKPTQAQLESFIANWRLSPSFRGIDNNTWSQSIQIADDKTIKRQQAYMAEEELYLLKGIGKKLEMLTAVNATNALVLISFTAEQEAKNSARNIKHNIEDYRNGARPDSSRTKDALNIAGAG